MEKHILTKQQREAGLTILEHEDFLFILDSTKHDKSGQNETIAIFGTHATIQEIQKAANDYLVIKAAQGLNLEGKIK